MRSEEVEFDDKFLYRLDGLSQLILSRVYKAVYYCARRNKHIGVLNALTHKLVTEGVIGKEEVKDCLIAK